MNDNNYLGMNMLKNLLDIMENGSESEYSAVVLYNNDKDEFTIMKEEINSQSETQWDMELYSISIINYKKFKFIIAMSHYSVGICTVLIHIPKVTDPIVLDINLYDQVYYFDTCYDIVDLASAYDRRNRNSLCRDVEIKKIKEKNGEMYNLELYKKDEKTSESKSNEKNTALRDKLNTIYDSDTVDFLLEKYEEMVSQYNVITSDEKLKILLENVKVFDMGNITSVEQLTNLTRLVYHEYVFNNNLELYDPEKESEESFLSRWDFKVFVRDFDASVTNYLKVLDESDEVSDMRTTIATLEATMKSLKRKYKLDTIYKLYSDGTDIGLYDVEKEIIIYQRDLKPYVYNNNYSHHPLFFMSDEKIKPFFARLVEETNFIDLFLGVILTNPEFLSRLNFDNNDEEE